MQRAPVRAVALRIGGADRQRGLAGRIDGRQPDGALVDVQEDRGTFEIRTSRPEPVLRELLARDTEISELEVTSAGLEEAFLSLTRQN